MDFQKEKQFDKLKANMDPPILDIKKEIHLEEHGDENSNINGVLRVFVKEEMPVPRDTDLTQNDCTGITHNGLADISHIFKEDHAFADYRQEVQDRETKMDIDETTNLWNSQFLSSLPDVSEADVKSQGSSPRQTGQNSYRLSKTMKTVPDFHPGTLDQLDSSQLNGDKVSDCVDVKDEVIEIIPESLTRKVDKILSFSSQFIRDSNSEQELSPLFLGTISGKNSVQHENIETNVKKEDDKEHNSESTIVYPSSKCHRHIHQPCSMTSGQISISKNKSIFARSEKEENDEDMISPNNHMSCTALASNISDQVASYGDKDDTLTHDNEFSLVIDNAESDDVIKGKEAMDKVKKCQYIFTTQRLKQKGTCSGKERCSRTSASLTNKRTVMKSLRNVKPKDRDDRDDDDLEPGDSTSILAWSEDIEEVSKSNTFKKTRMSANKSRASSINRETDTHPCPMCKSTFSTQSNQQRHTSLEHDGIIGKAWRINQKKRRMEHSLKQAENICTSINLEAQPEDQRMKAKHIDDYVEKSIDLNSEMFKQCSDNKSVLSDENFELSSEIGCPLKHTVTRSRERLFKCDECGKFFGRKGTLRGHMRTHTGEKPFKCDECGKCFTFSGGLHVHMKIHTGDKPFKCNECEKCFSVNYWLQRHMRTHTREKPFKCDVCGKCFCGKVALQGHMRTHKGEKPFKCDECGKCYKVNDSLQRHIKKHSGEKLFKCDVCGKCFDRTDKHCMHMRVHTGEKPYRCDTCGKCFSQKANLSLHMRTHTREKPFKCDTCDTCFGQKISLSKHMRTHTGEKPYVCDQCGKCFSQRSSLHVHMKTHTGDKPFKSDECGWSFNHTGGLHQHMRSQIY